MKKWRFNTLLSGIAVINLLVLVGWVFGVTELTFVNEKWAYTKPITSISFLVLCFALLLIINSDRAFTKIIKGCSLASVLLISTSLLSYLITENPFALSGGNSAFTVHAGVPSIMTCVCFFVISYYGFFFDSQTLKKSKLVNSLGLFQIWVGSVALLGYLFNAPAFYYYYPSVSAAMSIITAFSFLCLGIIMHGIKQIRN